MAADRAAEAGEGEATGKGGSDEMAAGTTSHRAEAFAARRDCAWLRALGRGKGAGCAKAKVVARVAGLQAQWAGANAELQPKLDVTLTREALRSDRAGRCS